MLLDQIEKPVLRAIKDMEIDPRVPMMVLRTTLCRTIVDRDSGVNVLLESSRIVLARPNVVAPDYSIRLANQLQGPWEHY